MWKETILKQDCHTFSNYGTMTLYHIWYRHTSFCRGVSPEDWGDYFTPASPTTMLLTWLYPIRHGRICFSVNRCCLFLSHTGTYCSDAQTMVYILSLSILPLDDFTLAFVILNYFPHKHLTNFNHWKKFKKTKQNKKAAVVGSGPRVWNQACSPISGFFTQLPSYPEYKMTLIIRQPFSNTCLLWKTLWICNTFSHYWDMVIPKRRVLPSKPCSFNMKWYH